MIIQKIRLENYRSHKDTQIELSSGVNLILGVNGSGKSSILEAIGSILFDINDRSGKKTKQQFIKHGEKSAKIEIEFLANDGRSYSVVTPFSRSKTGVSTGKMILKDMVTAQDYNEDIREKLQELCGIKKEYQDIYDQIIIAKQNEFINIFKDSPKNREDTFNKIFNTQIYTEMSDSKSVLKEIEDKYQKQKEQLEWESDMLSSNLPDEKGLVQEWEEEKEKEKKTEKQIQEAEETKFKIEQQVSFYQKKVTDLEQKKRQVESKRETIQEKKKRLREAIQEARAAKKSRRLTTEKKTAYKEYQSLWKEIEDQKMELEVLQEKKTKQDSLLLENEKFSWEIAKEEKEIEELSLALKEAEEEQKILENLVQEGLSQELIWREQEKEYRKGQEELQDLKEKNLEFEKTFFALQERIEERKRQVEEKEKVLQEINRESLGIRLGEIARAKELLEKYRQEKSFAEEKRRLLEDAREQLEGKFCPLLQETCDNVKNVDVNFYFSDKIEALEREVNHLGEEIHFLLEKIKQEKELQEVWNRSNFFRAEIENLQQKREEEIFHLEKILLEREKMELLQKQILFALALENEEELQKKLNELLVAISSLQLEEKKKRLEKLQKSFQKEEEEKKNLEEQIERKKSKIEENSQKIDNSIDMKLMTVKNFVEGLNKKQQELFPAYSLYMEHIQRSNSMEGSIQVLNSLIGSIYDGRREIKDLEHKQKELELELCHFSLETVQKEKIEVEAFLLEQSKSLGVIKEKVAQLEKSLEKVKEGKEKIAKLALALRKVSTKLEKTKGIRNSIKSMGVNISKYMLESISQAASYNFQKITGRTEHILWSNEDKDKYGVYLVGKDGQSSFEHLSGGEQVVVAISLRETLTEYFSNARFMILDEPTNNLDQERKKLLAEYMAEMLKNLDQSIIVTHDNTFREMAERVIEL